MNQVASILLPRSARRGPLCGDEQVQTSLQGRRLLSGGNPQIAKADGDAPVQAYIAAMPGWKRDVGRRLDALIVRTVPGVRKAVKWNSPFYGVEGQGWFLGIHCFTNYVKLAFFRGTSLRPVPPGESKDKERATSTSARTTSSTRYRWRRGSGRRPPCPAGFRSAGTTFALRSSKRGRRTLILVHGAWDHPASTVAFRGGLKGYYEEMRSQSATK